MSPWGHDLVVELWQWDISALWHLLLSISIYLFIYLTPGNVFLLRQKRANILLLGSCSLGNTPLMRDNDGGKKPPN